MNKNIQIINLLNRDEKITKIEIDKTTLEIGAYFLKNILMSWKSFLKLASDIIIIITPNGGIPKF